MKSKRPFSAIVLAPLFAGALFFGTATMPATVAAASGCHLETRNPTDSQGFVSTYYSISFCTNPKTMNYVSISVTPRLSGVGSSWAVVYDLYVTNNTSSCTRDANNYLARHVFNSWVVQGGTHGWYTWNLYQPVNFGPTTMVCLRYKYVDWDGLYSTTFPFYGYV